MKRLIPFLVVGMAASFASSVLADHHHIIHGDDLHSVCNLDPRSGGGFCIGFTTAVFDARNCSPTVKMTLVREAVAKYLRDHPEQHHKPAAHLARKAIDEAFPCPGGAA